MPENIKIKDVRMLVTPNPLFVFEDETLDDVAKALIANPRLKKAYVVDDNARLVGEITLNNLVKQEFNDIIPSSSVEYFNALEFIGKDVAKDIMSRSIFVSDKDTLKTAFVKMYENDLDELPVIDEKHRLIGNIDMLELLTMLIEKKEQKAGKKYSSLASKRPFHKRFE